MIQVLYLNVGINDTSIILKCINDTSIILKCINDTTGLTPSHLLLVTIHGFPMSYVMVFVLCSVSYVNTRGDCPFYVLV